MKLSRRFGGKKFMWDGQVYSSEQQAQEAARKYSEAGFEVEVVAEPASEDEQFYVFTRREVKEIVVESKPL